MPLKDNMKPENGIQEGGHPLRDMLPPTRGKLAAREIHGNAANVQI